MVLLRSVVFKQLYGIMGSPFLTRVDTATCTDMLKTTLAQAICYLWMRKHFPNCRSGRANT